MRVRLKETPHGWVQVEVKKHWFSKWSYLESFHGDGQWTRAESYALNYLHPVIKEVK